MPSVRQIFVKAGLIVSLPFLVLTTSPFLSSVSSSAKEEPLLTFQEFESSCIDLGCYDEKARQLTVRFANQNSDRFYRYSNVSGRIWKKLNALNRTGGVGNYLNDVVVQHPEKYPFKEFTIQSFKTIPKNKKAGTQNESRLLLKAWRQPTLAESIKPLPSARLRLTAVFGMGTGRATAL
jgi:hypothetical protein